jgi:hypothetical protein
MVARHDLRADHQMELVDQPVGQQVGTEGPAAEHQGITVLLAQLFDGIMTARTRDDRRLVAPRASSPTRTSTKVDYRLPPCRVAYFRHCTGPPSGQGHDGFDHRRLRRRRAVPRR